MRERIHSVILTLERMIDAAERHSESDNKDTAQKYEEVVELLNAAVEDLEEAKRLFE